MAIYNLENLPKKDNIFLFDTNILLYLHNISYTDDRKYLKYSKIAQFLIENKCKVYLDTLVFNEFVNRFISNKLGRRFDKKTDRNSPKYNDCLNELKIIIDNLQIAYNIEWAHNKINLFDNLHKTNYLETFNKMEFSDWTIKETAKNIGAIIITQDNDFKKSNDVDILTI